MKNASAHLDTITRLGQEGLLTVDLSVDSIISRNLHLGILSLVSGA
jgi:hypothetical protein